MILRIEVGSTVGLRERPRQYGYRSDVSRPKGGVCLGGHYAGSTLDVTEDSRAVRMRDHDERQGASWKRGERELPVRVNMSWSALCLDCSGT